MNESAEYLYVVSPDGDRAEGPCKIGITTNLESRLTNIRSQSGHYVDPPLDYVGVYVVEVSSETVEREYKNILSNECFKDREEWFDLCADTIISFLESDDRCSPVEWNPDPDPKSSKWEDEEESQLSVYIPESIHRRLRIANAETGQPMKELTAEALDEYL